MTTKHETMFHGDTDRVAREAAKRAALLANRAAHDAGEAERWHATRVGSGIYTLTLSARGPATVSSSDGVECHAPSGYSLKSYSGAGGVRDRATSQILDYWHDSGVLRWSCPRDASCPEYKREGRCDVGGVHVRDVVNPDLAGLWMPMAGMTAVGRKDRAEVSHVVSAANGGAYCGCGTLPENGAINANRADADMAVDALPMSARALLAGWPAWWREHRARKASLARIA